MTKRHGRPALPKSEQVVQRSIGLTRGQWAHLRRVQKVKRAASVDAVLRDMLQSQINLKERLMIYDGHNVNER